MNLDITAGLFKSGKFTLMSTTALLIAFGGQMAYAQVDDTEEDEVVATGIRQSIKTASDFKRNADTAVDSITASDVGALPDLSVAEALARVPGVVAQRFDISSGNGGDFPSPEGGGNLIRGLTLVRSEFNSRDSFSANGGRALDFGTVPPELIGAVDVYKNSSADLIEGGIGGTINLRSLEPFDKTDPVAVISIDGTYTDLRDEWSPDFSVVLGNRWDTGAGEFGLLGSISSSELKSDLHGFQIGQVIPFDTGTETIALPAGFQLRTNDVDRKRESYYLAGQWRDNSGDIEVTAKYAQIQNEVDSNERTLEFFTDGESWNQSQVSQFTTTPFTSAGIARCNGSNDPDPAGQGCDTLTPVTGLFETGIISNGLRDWTGARGAPFTNLGINIKEQSKTDDVSLNVKWRPADQWFVQLDAHHTNAEFNRDRLWAGSRFFSDFYFVPDINNPRLTLIPDPTNNPNRRAGGGTPITTDISQPENSFLLFAADQFEDNEGTLSAFRGDVEYEFANEGWFDSVKFGARYATREQQNRQAGLNWAGLAPVWAGGFLPYSELAQPTFESVDYSDFFRGGVVQGAVTEVVFPDRDLIGNYDAFVAMVAGDPNIPNNADSTQFGDWRPLRVNGEVDYIDRGSVGNVTEDTQNYYARLDFGNEFGNGMSIDGNIGLRYTKTEVNSNGVLVYDEIADTPTGDPANPGPRPSDFSPEAVEYFTQPNEQISATTTDERWLPSLNVKWNLNDDSLIRFGVSQAVTRPNIGDLSVGGSTNGNTRFVRDGSLPIGTDGPPLDINLQQINISGGNPFLKPIESINWDLSYERYYGDNNSFSLAFFRKDIENNIIFGSQARGTETLDGDEVTVFYNGNLNQDEATINGMEVAITHFFENWTGIFGNLGVQANYTLLDAKTAPPPASIDADNDGVPDSFERNYRFGVDNYLGLSDGSANLIGIYQDDKMEMRLAYNWRSDYLSSYRDFVSGNPIFQEEKGYLDGSFKYDFTDNFQFRAQVANILDTKAIASQQIDQSGQRFGRTSFVGDRRVKVGVRYSY